MRISDPAKLENLNDEINTLESYHMFVWITDFRTGIIVVFQAVLTLEKQLANDKQHYIIVNGVTSLMVLIFM